MQIDVHVDRQINIQTGDLFAQRINQILEYWKSNNIRENKLT